MTCTGRGCPIRLVDTPVLAGAGPARSVAEAAWCRHARCIPTVNREAGLARQRRTLGQSGGDALENPVGNRVESVTAGLNPALCICSGGVGVPRRHRQSVVVGYELRRRTWTYGRKAVAFYTRPAGAIPARCILWEADLGNHALSLASDLSPASRISPPSSPSIVSAAPRSDYRLGNRGGVPVFCSGESFRLALGGSLSPAIGKTLDNYASGCYPAVRCIYDIPSHTGSRDRPPEPTRRVQRTAHTPCVPPPRRTSHPSPISTSAAASKPHLCLQGAVYGRWVPGVSRMTRT